MAPPPSAPKRIKVSSISKKKPITTLFKPGFIAQKNAAAYSRAIVKCPVSLETIFETPTDAHVRQFYDARNFSGTSFDRLSDTEKMAYRESLHDNLTLIGFHVYGLLFPSLLKNRIKLNTASHHYRDLNPATDQGRNKLEQRRRALARLQRVGSAHSVFHGLPYSVDKSKSILQFMGMDFDEDDSRQRFFLRRNFSVISGERGEVSSSSVYQSCSSALGLMWFSSTILGRPTAFESVILPLSVGERRVLEERWVCPPCHLDGAIRSWQTDWGSVFRAINVPHRNIAYVMLQRACQDKYVEGIHVSDAYGLFKATRAAPGDAEKISALFLSYMEKSKHNVESGPVVAVLDVVRQRPVESVGCMDGSVLGAIYLTYGEKAGSDAKAVCNTLQGGPTFFDASIGAKLTEIMAHIDDQLWKTRKKLKTAKTVRENLDPAGLNKKLEGGRMLDPTDPKAVEMMYDMLKGLSCGVWRPLKSLVGEALGPSKEYPAAFLQVSDQEADRLYEHAKNKGVLYSDVANLFILLALSNSFQRSQVMREATMNEFAIVPDGSHYRQTFRERPLKASTASASGGAMPVSHFNLSAEQSMIVHFLASVGHRFCNGNVKDDKRRLFLNSKGEGWTQADIRSRFKKIGEHWLAIPSFSPHASRSFWASHALNTGQVNAENVDDFSSYLQVSTATLRHSYMGSGAHSAAHMLGNEILGPVVNAACLGETTEKGAKPLTKKLGARRMEFAADARASLLKYGGKTRILFRDLVMKRKAGQLGEGEKWFAWSQTFFEDADYRNFKKFVDG
ncbi:unnamed protein product, partial [Pylaiella littoralis]